TRSTRDWSSDVCSSDLTTTASSVRFSASVSHRLERPSWKLGSRLHHPPAGAFKKTHGHRLGSLVVLHRRDGSFCRTEVFAGHLEIGRASCRERVWISRS